MDIVFGMKIRVKNSTSDLVKVCPHAVEVELNSMTQPFESGIAFAQTVRKLMLTNIVVTYNLVSFLNACANITHLGFTNVILDLPINDPWSQFGKDSTNIPLDSLESLEIKCFTFTEGVVEIMNFLHDKVSFKRLKDVIINVQNPPVIPYQVMFQRNINPATTHPLVKLLVKLRPTLRKFLIGRPNMPTILKFQYPEKDEFPPQLEHLEIHPYFREEWSPILREQNGLKIMNLGSCNVSRWNEIQGAVMTNASCLESFTIGGLSFGQIWDCAVFQTCSLLRNLSIEISHSNKVNLAMLPLQLKNLHVFGPVPKYEITAVAETLVGLESLKFTHLGRIAEFNNAEEDKVNLDVFKALLQLPNLKSLMFVTCSTISIDWDMISLWCTSVAGTHGFSFSEKYFQTHGEYFRNGISVELTDEFKRDAFDWSSVPMLAISDTVDMSTPDPFASSIVFHVQHLDPPAVPEDDV